MSSKTTFLPEILGECLAHLSRNSEFLRLDKRFKHNADANVHIIFDDHVAQMHFGVSFGQSNDGLDMSNSDWNRACRHGFASQFGVHARYFVLLHVEFWMDLEFDIKFFVKSIKLTLIFAYFIYFFNKSVGILSRSD